MAPSKSKSNKASVSSIMNNNRHNTKIRFDDNNDVVSMDTSKFADADDDVHVHVNDAADNLTSSDYYFDSYSRFGIHEEMLKDAMRTNTYQDVIFKNQSLFKNKVVLDVGAGTGILSLFCAKGGAAHVYAVECSNIADMAKQIVEINGYSDVITVIKGKIEEIELPVPKVDIIISEWMGYFLLYENMLDTVLYARDKWLVNDGLVLPDRASLFLTAIEDSQYKEDRIEFWDNVYGFDMSCIKETVIKEPLVEIVEQKQIVTNTQLLKTMDISKMVIGDASFTAPFKLVAQRNDYVHALVAYFDVTFTKCYKLMGFSTGPKSRATHWKQTILYLEDVLTICLGETITGTIAISQNSKNPREVDIKLTYELNGKRCVASGVRHYHMR
ncbi:hypothetical protein ACFE04_016094 [Oxalis oulophora]